MVERGAGCGSVTIVLIKGAFEVSEDVFRMDLIRIRPALKFDDDSHFL